MEGRMLLSPSLHPVVSACRRAFGRSCSRGLWPLACCAKGTESGSSRAAKTREAAMRDLVWKDGMVPRAVRLQPSCYLAY